jgi:hypothetical protein
MQCIGQSSGFFNTFFSLRKLQEDGAQTYTVRGRQAGSRAGFIATLAKNPFTFGGLALGGRGPLLEKPGPSR